MNSDRYGEQELRKSLGFYRFTTVFLLFVMFLIFLKYGQSLLPRGKAQPRTVAARGDLAQDEKTTVELFRQSAPSVVYITTSKVYRDLFDFDVAEVAQGSGSGFIWDEGGHIVTNYHVIQGANMARVTLADQTTWEAQVVGTAPDKDLAVLRIEPPQNALKPILLGTSHDLLVGQKVFAIGNPFGLDQTLTTGIISGLGRQIESATKRPIRDVIQTDAAINPGNSGGPLLDSSGRLIGINTAIYSPSGANAGVGFAVPVDTVNRIVPQLIRYGKVKRAGLGVSIVQDHVTRSFGYEGVLIWTVAPGSAAAKAGLRPTLRDARGNVRFGDILVAIDGVEVKKSNDLFAILDERNVGDRVSLKVLRGKETIEVEVALQEVE